MDPVTLAAVLGPALVTVLTKLAEKGVADPALKPLTDWLEKRTLGGYNQKKAEADLLKAVREALPPAGDSGDPARQRWQNALAQLGRTSRLAARRPVPRGPWPTPGGPPAASPPTTNRLCAAT